MLRKHSEVDVYKNDLIDLQDIEKLSPKGILLSPGPGRPTDSGISLPAVQKLKGTVPILGICLGHQIMGEVLGAKVSHALRPMHGRTSHISHNQTGLFANLPSPLRVMRYHSLVVLPDNLPAGLALTAQTKEGEIMGFSHPILKLEGVQFHPESILTEGGDQLIKNWVQMIWS